ncbi:MORC family CW-type zinc finger protein 3-like isoform X1 [Brienomyrus brachyistius]|uniref:MORC family CW-type zinc finger protein 3-like isoform X1 n=1 Tax=Brienomyrus brachyistius TaxID=42636 RepID=UPI0020B4085D|nr:MORC family CW-type zinc finger protein 3-like isoform X1 [Brienomyrus brachyistius]
MEKKWEEVYDFLSLRTYPSGYSKSQKLNLRRYASKFTVKGGDIFYGSRRAIKTKEEAKMLFKEFHFSAMGGHSGVLKTRSAMCSRFYWLGMSIDVQNWVLECDKCRKVVKPLTAPRSFQYIKLNPKFLHTNSTSHTWPFGAIAELIDNAYDPDVMAKQFWIDWTRIKGFDCLTFQDNGSGMTKSRMYELLSFGFSDKQVVGGHTPVSLYGNGFKSSSMRLGKDTIVFSKTRDTMSVGLLSQSYLENIQAKHVVVPIVTIEHDGQSPVEDAARLQNILKHSPFNTAKELLTELRAITSISSTGTRIIIWNLRRVANGETEFDLSTDRYDIRIPADACEVYKHRGVTQSVPEIIYSLRAYCSILYLKPCMQIIIRGQKVKTQLISKSLAFTLKDQYKPSFLKENIRITFGYNIKSKDEYGMMMYHKNRLIKAFERLGCQRKSGIRGVGVIGVIECNFLQPTHNKQDFDDTAEYRKTMNNLAVKLQEYWEEIHFKHKNENPNCAIPTEDIAKHPDQIWIQCDDCLKWRRLPDGIDCDRLPRNWICRMNPDPQYRSCQVEEDHEDSEDEQQSYPKPYKRQKKSNKIQQKSNRQQMPAPALPLPATPLSDSEQWRPAEGAPAGLSSESFTHPSCSGHNLPNDTMLMDCEDYVSTSPERVKQVPPHAVGVSSIDTKDMELAAPSVPPLISTTIQVTIKQEETQDDSWMEEAWEDKVVAKVLEENGPESPMLEVQQQPDGLLDTYKEQVNQLQQELEEMKHKCEHLQVMEIEREILQRRLEDMELKNSSLSCQCEQLNISQEETCRKLRNLRQRIGRLLVTFVPTLDLEGINLNSELMDDMLDQVLNENSEL